MMRTRAIQLLAVGAFGMGGCEINVDTPFDDPFLPGNPDFGVPPMLPSEHAHRAETPPPPVSGGTMAVSTDGALIVIADPDRDQIYFVDRANGPPSLLETLRLEPGTEPGRVVTTPSWAHVVYRGTHRVASIDLTTRRVDRVRETCREPRGVEAYDDQLHVACASGALWSFEGDAAAPARRLQLEPDLRDVVRSGDRLFVSVFRTGDVLELDAQGQLMRRYALPVPPMAEGLAEARVAWRMFRADDAVVVVHQLASSQPISINDGGYGGIGNVLPCSNSIVASAVTRIRPEDGVRSVGVLATPGLVVDAAYAPAADRLVWGSPSETDPSISLTEATVALDQDSFQCLGGFRGQASPVRPITSVVTAPDGEQFAFSREPAALRSFNTRAWLDLEQPSVRDTGHTVFHGTTFGGLSCASCHPEGTDDGHVWDFVGIGPRRTQVLRGGISETAPFHWDADFRDMRALAADVLARRMLGGELTTAQVDLLSDWMDTVPNLAPAGDVEPQAVARGRQIFERSDVQCANCHAGPRLMTSSSFDVGTGGVFQVPSLTALRYRAPYMHDGCAETLGDRLRDPDCGGGDQHGRTSHLNTEELQDLEAYLRSL